MEKTNTKVTNENLMKDLIFAELEKNGKLSIEEKQNTYNLYLGDYFIESFYKHYTNEEIHILNSIKIYNKVFSKFKELEETKENYIEIHFTMGMAESILCYHPNDNCMENKYMQKYIVNLGKEVVEYIVSLVAESIGKVNKDVYTDNEGCNYSNLTYQIIK